MQRNRQKNTQNIIHFLRDRESCLTGRYHNTKYSQLTALSYDRNFYKSITPKLTVQNVETPYMYMRKFTPDGSLLLSFSNDQRSLITWTYRGIGNAAALFQHEQRECIPSTDQDATSAQIRENIFESLFRKRYTIRLAVDIYSRFHLHREFSIFLDDGRYVLLAAMGFSEKMMPVSYYWIYPDTFDDLEVFAYTFFLVDLRQGVISDVLSFHHDSIMLSHNHGVSVYGKTIAVLSKCRQCVLLFEHVDGKLIQSMVLGPFDECDPMTDKSLTLESLPPLSHIKQRILAFMYREILEIQSVEIRRERLRDYYKQYFIIERMLMEKMQLLDSDNILIRYEERPNQVPSMPSNERSPFKLYVFYSLSDDRILKICQKDSVDLLYMLRNYCDQFRNVRSLHTLCGSSSPSNNEHFRNSFNIAINSIPGGPEEAARSFNPTVPVSTQSYSVTQYLNYSLFNYDDRLISVLERPKCSSTEPIRFTDRITNQTKFRLHLEPRSDTRAASRELVAFIFHPYEPFLISIQKLSTRYVVNFHVYNNNTIVQN